MKCLVCDSQMRLDTLQQTFSIQPLFLCNRCSSQLKRVSNTILFEKNEWTMNVIDRLNRGDIILIKIFEFNLDKLLKKDSFKNRRLVYVPEKECVIDWVGLLVKDKLTNQSKSIGGENETFALRVTSNGSEFFGITLLG